MTEKKSHLRDLLTGAEVGRLPYFVVGSLLAAVKYNLDRLIAMVWYDVYWTPFSYLHPSDEHTILNLTPELQQLYLVLAAVSVPFLSVGIWLTVRRLRSIGLGPWLAIGFILPVVNMLLFAALCVLPAGLSKDTGEAPRGFSAIVARVVPESPIGAAFAGLLFTLPPAVLMTLLGIYGFEDYGYGMFVGLPFVVGAGSVAIYGLKEQRKFASCMAVAALSVWVLGIVYFIAAIEGAICLAMAFPIGLVLSLAGGVLGYFIQRAGFRFRDASNLLLVLFASIPLLMGFEHVDGVAAPPTSVTTTVVIDAPPQRVWDKLLAFEELPAPDDWVLQSGVAYPLHARIEGEGVGAIRYCVFTTGPFVEPIEVWDEPRLLKFSVQSQPPAMTELSYTNIDAPHIDGFLKSRGGQFKLTELPGGKTQLEGTTWYTHHVWPTSYWKVYSDEIIHRIHQRVLDHIRLRAEESAF